ncbi:HypC/HybG/HupF family hydrogenase formation chaperone [bacterium]|nr:HypC/HybG/HupF family hydrogenase formation chaperone [bacterium]
MSDVAPGEILFEARVLSIADSEEGRLGLVNFRGVRILIQLSLLPEVQPGDFVLVQGRFALSRLEEVNEVC